MWVPLNPKEDEPDSTCQSSSPLTPSLTPSFDVEQNGLLPLLLLLFHFLKILIPLFCLLLSPSSDLQILCPDRYSRDPLSPPVLWIPHGFLAGRGADHPPPIPAPMSLKGRAIFLLTLWASVACYRENPFKTNKY